MKEHSQNSLYRCHSTGTDQREITVSQQSSDRPQLLPWGEQQSPRDLDRDQGKYPTLKKESHTCSSHSSNARVLWIICSLPSLTWQLALWSVRQHPTWPFEGLIARKQNECVHQANNLPFTISYQAADVPPKHVHQQALKYNNTLVSLSNHL